jgi:hypothetical protein
LLLGSELKSDAAKAMTVYSKGDSDVGLPATIFRNVDIAKALVNAMMRFDIALGTEANLKRAEFLSEYQLDLREPIFGLDPKIGEALSSI